MLSAASLGYLSAQDPVLYEFLTGMVGSFNQLQKKLGIDAVPASQANAAQALPAPAPPASLAVTASLGVFTVTVGASPNAQPGVQYILEIASDTAFSAANTSVLALGAALGMTLNLGSVTRYFRVRAKYPTSAYSVYTYYGTASQPIGVVGGTAAFSAAEVDGGGTITDLNLSSTTPAAPAGAAQVKFQHDALTPEDVSAYLAAFGPSGAGHGPGAVPDPGAVAGTTKFLCEDGTFKAPGASSGVASLDGITGAILLSPGAGIAIADNTPGAGDIEFSGVVFGPSGAGHASGDVPDPGSVAGTTRALFEDGTWKVPSGGGGGANVADLFVAGYPLSSSSDLTNARANDSAYQGIDSAPASAGSLDDEFAGSVLNAGRWTWFNQGTSAANVSDGMLTLTAQASAGNFLSGITQPAPATPWTVAAGPLWVGNKYANYISGGLVLGDGTGKFITWTLIDNVGVPTLFVIYYTNATTVSSQPYVQALLSGGITVPFQWFARPYLGIQDDGANLNFRIGLCGKKSMVTMFSASRTGFLSSGPSLVGICADSYTSGVAVNVLVDWFRRTQ